MSSANFTKQYSNFKDLQGQTFGRLTAIRFMPTKVVAGRRVGYPSWECRCSCGNLTVVIGGNLRAGTAQSCGCLQSELAKARLTTHGMSGSPEFESWRSMWDRCTNPNDASYPKYRDRAPPENWRSFEKFYSDMGPMPGPKHSIDRVNNDQPYGPENCRWATWAEQTRNSPRNVWIEFMGERRILTDWAAALGTNPSVLRVRIKKLGVDAAFKKWTQ